MLTLSNHVIYGTVVCRDMLMAAALASGSPSEWDWLDTAEVLRVDPARRRQGVRMVSAMLAQQQHAIPAGEAALP